MHMPSAQAVSPGFAALAADYEKLSPPSRLAKAEADRLFEVYERHKPENPAKAEVLRVDIGLIQAEMRAEDASDALWGVVNKAHDAEPTSWADLAIIAHIVREANGVDVEGRTNGSTAELPDFARLIDRVAAATAAAEAADAALVELAVRYERMHQERKSRPGHQPDCSAELERVFDAVARACPATLQGLAAVARVGRLRQNNDLLATVAFSVERLAGPLGPSDAVSESPSCRSLLSVAQEAEALFRQALDFESKSADLAQAGRKAAARAMKAESDASFERIESVFDRGLDLPARSFADLLAGLMAIASSVHTIGQHHVDAEVEARMEVIEAKILRRLYGLRGFVERCAGIPSNSLCGQWCLEAGLDPFTHPTQRDSEAA